MNRTLIAAIAFAAASSAFAESPNAGTSAFVPAKSRAEVQAELQQYKQSGVNPWSQGYNQLTGFSSTRTRAEVTGDFLRSRDATAAFTAEDSGSSYIRAQAGKAAAPVIAGQPANAQ